MKGFFRFSLLLIFAFIFLPSLTQAHSVSAKQQITTPSSISQSTYSLSQDKLTKAIALHHVRTEVNLSKKIWYILLLFSLIALGGTAKFRDWAVATSRYRWVQCLVFVTFFFLTITIANLPFDIYSHYIERAYAQSIQGWENWSVDQIKFLLLSLVLIAPIIMLLFGIIRKSPKYWWLWFWLASLPIILLIIFVEPFVEPIFNKFELLQQNNPALVERLQKIVHHGEMQIQSDRIFVIKASEKSTGINAYITGIGASKRVVLNDTLITSANQDEISFIFGHEMGHYVLKHTLKYMALLITWLFIALWLGNFFAHALIARYGIAWKISSMSDWAAFPLIILIISVFFVLSEPIINGFSRAFEHDADIYGQEVVQGIVVNPQKVACDSLQLLGESYLDAPNPNPFLEFWAYNHPSITHRKAFAATYNPWISGKQPKYFMKQ